MKKNVRFLAIVAASAVALAGFGSASAAQAADGQVLTGTITLLGKGPGQTPGPAITGGNQTDNPMFYGITITAGCPSGYRARSDAGIWQNGTRLGGISTARFLSTPPSYGKTGLDGQPVALSDGDTSGFVNVYAANKGLSGLTSGTLQTGAFELRYYCSADSNVADYTTDKYFVLPLMANADGTWGLPPAPATATTTALTGTLGSDKKATLTATVAPAAAAGSVDFYSGTTKIGTSPVASGTASFTTAALPDGQNSFTAKFVPTGTAYSGSTSGTFTVSVGGTAYDITVTIPSGIGSLRLEGYTRTTVDLGTATLDGTLLRAQGNLPGGLRVIDDRQVGAAAWSLTGQNTDFATSDSSKSFNGGYLGWTPTATGQGQPGPQVAPITSPTDSDATRGLKAAARVLAYGQVTAANAGTTVTNVGAQLNLAVPSQTAAGKYNSVLTLTLS